jgi:acyl-CoA reductase-like NAD-dependent aldehyde dehydrogenase
MDTYPIYAGGEFITTGTPFNVISPFDGRLIGTTYLAGKAELEKSILAAQTVRKRLENLTAWDRYQVLMQIASAISSGREVLAAIVSGESGKPMKYALGEVDRAAQTFLVAAEETKRIPGEVLSIDWTPAGKGKEAIIKYFPIGLIAGIAPFNFPLNLAVHKIAPALAAGNAIILKPARSTPLSVLALAQIIDKTNLPKGAVSILPMDRMAGNQLVTDPRFQMLSFTGSPAVGWQMKNEAGKKKICLELGGNAGVIVSDSAENLPDVVAKCMGGSFSYSGQVCIHVQRIYVQKKIFNAFISQFVELTHLLQIGDPAELKTDISAMIDEENALRVEAWVNEAISQGAKVLCGAKRNGNIYAPTVLTNTLQEMKVCALEIFGPVVTIEPYDNFDEALEVVNQSEFGLQAGVFTNRLNEMNQAFKELEVGGVILNDVPTFRVDHMPYGGLKNSGFGREGVKYAIAEMMEPKILVKNI